MAKIMVCDQEPGGTWFVDGVNRGASIEMLRWLSNALNHASERISLKILEHCHDKHTVMTVRNMVELANARFPAPIPVQYIV